MKITYEIKDPKYKVGDYIKIFVPEVNDTFIGYIFSINEKHTFDYYQELNKEPSKLITRASDFDRRYSILVVDGYVDRGSILPKCIEEVDNNENIVKIDNYPKYLKWPGTAVKDWDRYKNNQLQDSDYY